MADRAPFPTADFNLDDRVSFDTVTQTHKLEDERGEEWEWVEKAAKWVPVMDEAEMEQQREIYKLAGVDENEPAVDPRKRKVTEAEDGATNGNAKKQKADAKPPTEKKNHAVFLTSLPEDVTKDELHQVFSKYGLIAESTENGDPRIKIYVDDDGKSTGEGLIVYFRPESVKLAIDMADESYLRPDKPSITGPMRVQEADQSFKSQKDKPLSGEQAKKPGTGANRDRRNVIKKNEEMNSRLADWSDDDDNPSTIKSTSNRWDKVLVLKHMFTLKTLANDKEAIIDIKEEVREEAEKFGKVTNVVLYDQEDEGVVTVRFSDAVAARACLKKFNGRIFDGKRVIATIADGKEKFKKSKKDADDDGDEEKRMADFSNFIES